ncbi:hypothetical protein HW532_10605 [Kaustia mangrovi]|uniref:H+/citrate symporter n=1 Tax=Kaustia mangrovi TaxID=2593653 RepID=A0A7S8C4E4_9HYPH|nr:hypothetical protein [Kaustia mangrovi]QPC43099.1 hypothetical protein HW532_10605 [Kaustia mangrovi]
MRGQDHAADETAPRLVAALSGGAIVIVWAGVLLDALFAVPGAAAVAVAALAVYLVLQAPRLNRLAWVHLAVGAAAAGTVLATLDDPVSVLMEGLARSAFIASLFAALGMLREAAQISPTILRAGRMLVHQPPGRRYIAITAGSALFGAILNFGTVTLLGGMINQANTLQAAHGQEDVRLVRQQRMLTALLRGFATIMFWCPLTVAFAVVTATIPGADWPPLVMWGGLTTICVMAIGWTIDRLTMPRRRLPVEADPFRFSRLAPLIGLIAAVFVLAFSIEETTSGQLIHGVILIVPLIAVIWLVAGHEVAGARRLAHYLVSDVPGQRQEVAILGNAAFLGTAVAALVPPTALEALIGPGSVAPVLLPVIALWLVVGAGQIGANPLLTATVIATLVANAPTLDYEATAMGLALVMGWSLTVGSSPAAAATMIIGRFSNHSAAYIAHRWNGLHTAVSLLFCSVILMVVHTVG